MGKEGVAETSDVLPWQIGKTLIPRLVESGGKDAVRRFVEFFVATIRNRNTREAYAFAVVSFFEWCDRKMLALTSIEPIAVAAYIEELGTKRSKQTVKQHLAAIRMLFDWFVTGHIVRVNPAWSVRGPRHSVKRGKTPVLSAEEARVLLDSIDATSLSGLRDRALIAVMVFSFARVSAAVGMRVADYFPEGKRWRLRLQEKGGKDHVVPCHHVVEDYLDKYLEAACIVDQRDGPLFRTIGRDGKPTLSAMTRSDAFRMVKRRATRAGLPQSTCCHSFRATGITWKHASKKRASRFRSPNCPAFQRHSTGSHVALNLCAFGRESLATREMIIKSIEPNPDLSAKLTLIDHAPAIHQADVGAIPPYDPGISRDPIYRDGPEDPVIEQIRSDDWVMVRDADGSLRPRIVVYLRRPAGAGGRPLPTQIQLRYRPAPPMGPLGPWIWTPLQPVDPARASIDHVEIGETYELQLRYVTAIGQVSGWVGATHTVVGNVLPPPDVRAFDVQAQADGTRLYSWDLGEIPPDIAGVLLRYQPASVTESWSASTPLHTGVLDPASPHEFNLPGGGTWRFGIKMVDTTGNESVNALFVIRTLGTPRQPGSVLTVDAKALGWPGTKTSCAVRPAGPVLEAISSATWDQLGPVFNVPRWSSWHRWNLAPASPIAYEHPAIDLGGVVMVTPQITLGYIGQPLIELRYSADGVTFTEWVDFNTIIGNAVSARYLHWRVTVTADPSGGFFVPTITDMIMDALAEPTSQILDNVNTASLAGVYRVGPGDVRLPIDGRFHVVRTVNLSFNGMGAGYSYIVVDKDASPGPRVQIFNERHEPAEAVIDATVDGF